MKILLTGAYGFIGSYFKKTYENKYEIAGFSFQKDDFDTFDLAGVDTVVHLSALVHQMGGASEEAYEQVNVVQTLDFADKAKQSGVGHFVFMSSVKVYGEERDVAYTEDSPCKPEDAYGKSKLRAEEGLLKLEDDGFKVSIIRTPVVYGYGVKANIKNLVSLVQKVPILPFGGINNRRSMVYVGNLCYIVDAILQQQKTGIFLASDGEPLSTTRLIELIAQALGKKVYLIKMPLFESLLKLLKPSFHKRLYESLEVDNAETRKILNLKSPYSVEDGIRLMIQGEET
ncbi:NAD-dependent epimerase/dehydratase family protein [Sulfurimonas sp.]